MRTWITLLTLCLAVVALGAAPAKTKSPKPDEDYYELFKVFVDTMDQVERNYVKDVSRRELIEAAIGGMLSKLDPYSNYITPDETERFRTSVENEFGGIGIQVSDEEGQLLVISPLVGTPAYRAGIAAGDRIVAINGKPSDGITLEQATAKLKGPVGTKVTITVLGAGDAKRRDVELTRELIHVETVLGDRRGADDHWDYFLDRDGRIGYIRLNAFSRDTAAELRKALAGLQKEKLRALILDLRFNSGGLLTSAIEVSDLFVRKGRIVSTAGRNSAERVWQAKDEGTFDGFPMAVLVNRYSASASEIVAACLQDHRRAIVIGERTWGKGSVQNVIELEEGKSLLKLTTASYLRPSGKNIHRFPDAKETDEWGVRPDEGFELKLDDRELVALMTDRRRRDIVDPRERAKPAETTAAKTKPVDRQLQKAVDHLGSVLAKAGG